MTTVELDPTVRLHSGPEGALLVGGQPLRVLRLNPAARVVTRWRDSGGAPSGPAETALAARLHAHGLAVVRPDSAPFTAADVTVVVPAHDRPDALDRCLATVTPTTPAAPRHRPRAVPIPPAMREFG